MKAGKQILVVEDEVISAMGLQKTLKHMGYIVPITVSSGEKAIEMVKENKPDMVLIDINLKGEMNGFEIASKIHSFSDIPIIFMTAYSDENTLERTKSTEFYGHLIKPFSDIELQKVIEIAFSQYEINKFKLENETHQDNSAISA